MTFISFQHLYVAINQRNITSSDMQQKVIVSISYCPLILGSDEGNGNEKSTSPSGSAYCCRVCQNFPPSLYSQISMSRSRSISVGEQWLQLNSVPTRSHTMSVSPSRGYCSIRFVLSILKCCLYVHNYSLC